jgi:hypothetical protein
LSHSASPISNIFKLFLTKIIKIAYTNSCQKKEKCIVFFNAPFALTFLKDVIFLRQGSCYVALAGLKLVILLPQSPEYWY